VDGAAPALSCSETIEIVSQTRLLRTNRCCNARKPIIAFPVIQVLEAKSPTGWVWNRLPLVLAYSRHYRITDEELAFLNERIGVLRQIVAEASQKHIEELREAVGSYPEAMTRCRTSSP